MFQSQLSKKEKHWWFVTEHPFYMLKNNHAPLSLERWFWFANHMILSCLLQMQKWEKKREEKSNSPQRRLAPTTFKRNPELPFSLITPFLSFFSVFISHSWEKEKLVLSSNTLLSLPHGYFTEKENFA